ncbi:MAG: Ni/Fe hydrogenase subunit alpha [Vulcanimicrobiota bacterium]
MSRRIVIDPVTRIEGHAKISVDLNEQGQVARARFHVVELRGFEKFCQGRPFWEMPGLTSRICGICPVSHLLASAKAGDALLAVRIPESATQLRRMMNLAQIVQSHALSFFHLSAPDLLLGMDSPPGERNLVGLLAQDAEFARAGIRLRKFGQDLIQALGGKKVHPAWAVAGGVRHGLEPEARQALRQALPEAMATALEGMARWRRALSQMEAEREHFGKFPGLFMGLVDGDGNWEHYDGRLALIDEHGQLTDLDPAEYAGCFGEAVEDWSYLKFPYYKPRGYPDGSYRVGPLARLNVCYRVGTPRADELLQDLRDREGPVVTSSFFYHEARLIEIIAGLEKLEALLADPAAQPEPWRARAGVNRLRGVGCSEAPRGTLFHDYTVDENGVLQQVNLMIATGQNNAAMNRTLSQIAGHFLTDPENISEGVLNRLEAGIRAFDPCLSCSTHALGKMPLKVEVWNAAGGLVSERSR